MNLTLYHRTKSLILWGDRLLATDTVLALQDEYAETEDFAVDGAEQLRNDLVSKASLRAAMPLGPTRGRRRSQRSPRLTVEGY
jgi:hypothetical protein